MAQAGAEVTWRGVECCCSLRSARALSVEASLRALKIAARSKSVGRGEEQVARAPVEKTARAVWRALGGGTSISCDAVMAEEQERDLRDRLAELREQNGFSCQVRACLARVLELACMSRVECSVTRPCQHT